MRIHSYQVAALLSALLSSYAMAEECTGRFLETCESAKRARQAEVQSTWIEHGRDCKVKPKLDAIFQYYEETGPAIRRCKNKGVNDGTRIALEQIGKDCASPKSDSQQGQDKLKNEVE